jgi:amino acid transporter
VSIFVCALVYSVFSLSAFAALVVIDVFLNMLVLMAEFFALWKLRFTMPKVDRKAVPGGWFGLVLVTLAPGVIVTLAIYSQFVEEGMASISWALVAMAVGIVLYFPIKQFVKPGVPDVDPFVTSEGDD